jgi:hypothetical protein
MTTPTAKGAAKAATEVAEHIGEFYSETAAKVEQAVVKTVERDAANAELYNGVAQSSDAAAAKAALKKQFSRPSGFRKGVRDKVWDQAVKDSPDGIVRDPLTGKAMQKDEPWDMGHKPGWEFRKHQAQAMEGGSDLTSRKEFLDEYNNSDHYRPELPLSNQGHQAEGGAGQDYWSEYYNE